MRYLLAHMLEGEVKDYHVELSDRLAEQFALVPVSSRIDPHLTLKAPFETKDPHAIEAIVEAFAKKEKSEPFMLSSFHDFNKKVIYMAVDVPKQTYMLIQRLQDKLRSIPWLRFSPHEFPITLHATLCYPKNPQQAKEILSFLSSENRMQFNLSLNNVTLLKKERGRWIRARLHRLL